MQNLVIKNSFGEVFVSAWQCEQASASLVIVHDMFDHAKLYDDVACALNEEGISVFCFDLVSHGAGYADGLGLAPENLNDRIMADLASVIQLAAKPVVVMGVGVGCNIILNAHSQNRIDFDGLVLVAPLFLGKRFRVISQLTKTRGAHSTRVASTITTLVFGGFDRRFGEGIGGRFASDLQLVGRLNLDRLVSIPYTYGWYRNMRKIMRATKNYLGELDCLGKPLLIMHGEHDASIDSKYLGSGDVVVIERARHKIFLDGGGRQAISALKDFICQQDFFKSSPK